MPVIDKHLILLIWQSQNTAVGLCFSAFENCSACLPLTLLNWLKSTAEARHQTSSYSLCEFSVWFSFQGRVGEMVWCQVWCVSKLILHRLTLNWLHTKPMKINKSIRSYFYLLYSAGTTLLTLQLCLQHILSAQAADQSPGTVRWLSPALSPQPSVAVGHLDLSPYHDVEELGNSWRTNVFWVTRKRKISE